MEIKTATPEMVVVKLYEGALRFIRTAKLSQESGKIAARATAIAKALAIVNELQHSLNLKDGGEIARNLDSLYFYVTDRLLEANARCSAQALADASGVLSTLNEAWVEIAKRPRGESVVGAQSDPILDASERARMAAR